MRGKSMAGLAAFIGLLCLTACSKKNDPKISGAAGGGASSQSIVTVQGAGQ